MRILLVALLVGGLACGPTVLPNPRVLSIDPATVLASDSNSVVVRVAAVLPFQVDLGAQTAEVNPSLSVEVGPVQLGTASYQDGGQLSGTIPSTLPPGHYDVRLTLADGRTGLLEDGYDVAEGHWPDAYVFDPVADQQSGRPFGVTLRAAGANGGSFHGNVALSVEGDGAAITPSLTGAFVHGVRVETVTVSGSGEELHVVARDIEGHSGTSNAFHLEP